MSEKTKASVSGLSTKASLLFENKILGENKKVIVHSKHFILQNNNFIKPNRTVCAIYFTNVLYK
jgi:hypothetical protein